jgi:hypothetical protein
MALKIGDRVRTTDYYDDRQTYTGTIVGGPHPDSGNWIFRSDTPIFTGEDATSTPQEWSEDADRWRFPRPKNRREANCFDYIGEDSVVLLDADPTNYFKLAKSNPIAILGRSDNLKVGQRITKIGSPEGIFNIVTYGSVASGLRRDITDLRTDVFYIDLFISPGDSGAPVFDTEGHVLGMARGAVVSDESVGGVNYVVAIDAIKAWLETEGIDFVDA